MSVLDFNDVEHLFTSTLNEKSLIGNSIREQPIIKIVVDVTLIQENPLRKEILFLAI